MEAILNLTALQHRGFEVDRQRIFSPKLEQSYVSLDSGLFLSLEYIRLINWLINYFIKLIILFDHFLENYQKRSFSDNVPSRSSRSGAEIKSKIYRSKSRIISIKNYFVDFGQTQIQISNKYRGSTIIIASTTVTRSIH